MNPKITLFFVLVLAALALIVFGLQPSAGPDTAASPTPQPTVVNVDPAKVRRVTVEWAGGKTVVEKSPEGVWQMTQPGPEAADQVRLRSFVGRLSVLKASGEVKENAQDLASFGLDKPTGRAVLELEDGASVVLLVGNATPVGTGYYARVESAPNVFVVQSLVQDDLKRFVENPPRPVPSPTARPSLEATPAPEPPPPTPFPTPAS